MLLIAAILFHWNVPEDAISGSPFIKLGFTGSVLLLHVFCVFILQERHEFFTEITIEAQPLDYRPRRRLVVWEILNSVISLLIVAVSFYTGNYLANNY